MSLTRLMRAPQLIPQVWIERGEQLLFLEPNHQAVGKVSNAYALKAHQYIKLQVSVEQSSGVDPSRPPQ